MTKHIYSISSGLTHLVTTVIETVTQKQTVMTT